MNFLALTLGKVIPKYRTVADWVKIYEDILSTEGLCEKTLSNRKNHIKKILTEFGEESIGSLKPHVIAQFITSLAKTYPVTAKRTLIEIRCMLNHALLNGWISVNPAMAVKPPKTKVERLRLSFEDWRKTYEWSNENQPGWVNRMLLLALVTGQRRGDLIGMKFSDVWDGYLHITQQKTGTRLALPLSLKHELTGLTLAEVVESCKDYAKEGTSGLLLRKSTGEGLSAASASWRFEQAREGAIGLHQGPGNPPSLHEIRSLSERTYREQGIDTKTLLGHSKQQMTDMYNDDRGLDAKSGKWKTLEVS